MPLLPVPSMILMDRDVVGLLLLLILPGFMGWLVSLKAATMLVGCP